MRKFSLLFGLTLGLILADTRAAAHEGHGIPGALPPGPHGGVVAESAEAEEHSHDHGHGGDNHPADAKAKPHVHAAEEKEYFFSYEFK